MKDRDLEKIRSEILHKREAIRQRVETEADTVSETVLKERENRNALLTTLEDISQVASAALDRNRERPSKTGDVLEWRKPLP
jgi:hypothetical protein